MFSQPHNQLVEFCSTSASPEVPEESKPSHSLKFNYRHQTSKANQLRKNRSAYMFFSSEIRARFKHSGIRLDPNQTIRTISSLWKQLSDQERVRYDAYALQDKERYVHEKQHIAKTNPDLLIRNRTKLNHVKKPLSAYDFYMKEMFPMVKAANPDLYSAGVLKMVSKQWKALNEQDRLVYDIKAEIDKQEKQEKLKAMKIHKLLNDSRAASAVDKKVPSANRNKKLKCAGPQNDADEYVSQSISISEKPTEPVVDLELETSCLELQNLYSHCGTSLFEGNRSTVDALVNTPSTTLIQGVNDDFSAHAQFNKVNGSAMYNYSLLLCNTVVDKSAISSDITMKYTVANNRTVTDRSILEPVVDDLDKFFSF